MLQEDMKKAFQSNRRTPPAGFEERSDMQILQLTTETKPGRRMPRAAMILCVLLAVMSLATALAATVDVFNARLHVFWPEAAELLMPVNASCEREGIRMEVLSAAVKDGKAHVTFSLQDLEGDRIDEYTAPSFSELAFPTEARTEGEDVPISTIAILSYDAKTRTGIYAQEFDYDPALVGEDYEIPLYIQYLYKGKYDAVDLEPLLKKHGRDAEAVQAPDHAQPLLMNNPASRTVLEPAGNLKIPLNDYAELSEIGWIDGQLHVRIHYLPEKMGKDGEGTVYPLVFCSVQMTGADGVSPWFRYKDQEDSINFGWAWDDDGDGFSEWEEYIFPCTPDEVREGTLRAITNFIGETEAIEGNWYVKIPLRMIQFEKPDQ